MTSLIMILGAPNDESGALSDIAVGRAEQGIEEHHNHPGSKVLCTGGFGGHFNTTPTPHARYVKEYLSAHGVPSEDIVEDPVLSHDTIEDAALSKPIVEKYAIRTLIVVTSDFHMKRVQYIFTRVFPKVDIIFSSARTDFSAERYEELRAHEKRELQKLKEEGILLTPP